MSSERLISNDVNTANALLRHCILRRKHTANDKQHSRSASGVRHHWQWQTKTNCANEVDWYNKTDNTGEAVQETHYDCTSPRNYVNYHELSPNDAIRTQNFMPFHLNLPLFTYVYKAITTVMKSTPSIIDELNLSPNTLIPIKNERILFIFYPCFDSMCFGSVFMILPSLFPSAIETLVYLRTVW